MPRWTFATARKASLSEVLVSGVRRLGSIRLSGATLLSRVGFSQLRVRTRFRAVGPLAIGKQEVRTGFGDDYLVTVELDLDVHGRH